MTTAQQRNPSGLVRWLFAVTIAVPVAIGTAPGWGQDGALDRARIAEARRIEVISQAIPATIGVYSIDGSGGGSGVIITHDGYALTNYHVVAPCGSYMHCSLPDGRIYDAVLTGVDPVGDIALIKLTGRDDFPTAVIGDSDELKVGDFCFAVGNPFLLARNFQPSVSWGIVSGVHRYQYPSGTLLEYANSLQTDAAINPGNSGGPLFNQRGELVGINGRGSFEKRGRVNVGVGYAITINQVRRFQDHLACGRIVDHATLGATVKSGPAGRVIVHDILSECDAWRRGLRVGDEIITLGHRGVTSVNDFKNWLGDYPAGWQIPLEYRRDGTIFSTVVRLESVHPPGKLAELVQQGKFLTDEQPDESGPGNLLPTMSTVPPPDSVRPLIEHRPGFANYYFNRQRTESLWTGFQVAAGIETGTLKSIRLFGRLDDGRDVRIALAPKRSGMGWGDQSNVMDSEQEWSIQVEPSGSGGLLMALHMWFRLMRSGPSEMGDVSSLGEMPAWPGGQPAQWMVCNLEGVQIRFLFDPETGLLNGLEYWPDGDRDPAEIRFEDYRSVGAAMIPHQLNATCGDLFHWQIQFESITVNQPAGEKQ